MNTLMINEIAQAYAGAGVDENEEESAPPQPTETTPPVIVANIDVNNHYEQPQSEMSEAEIAQTDMHKLDETAVTPNRVEQIGKLAHTSSVEEIPQIVMERYKTLNLLPLGPTKDDEEEEEDDIDVKTEHSLSLGAEEKEEIAQRKSE